MELYAEWVKEEKIDIVNVLFVTGIIGLLSEFEQWLVENDYIVKMEE